MKNSILIFQVNSYGIGLHGARFYDGGLTQSPFVPHARGWDIFFWPFMQASLQHAKKKMRQSQNKVVFVLPRSHEDTKS